MHIATTDGGFNEVARAELGEHAWACPAFADGRIYIRGMTHLFCIGAKKAQEEQPQGTDE
jgi:outer membrane protein assembly factor BamB